MEYQYYEIGWICPRCQRIYSPKQEMCLFCGKNSEINGNTNTILPTFSSLCPNDINWDKLQVQLLKDQVSLKGENKNEAK
mgnify:CR=1 FL=1